MSASIVPPKLAGYRGAFSWNVDGLAALMLAGCCELFVIFTRPFCKTTLVIVGDYH